MMEDNNFKENLKHLKEIILDEERIITYISVSKELCIHVNEAKLLLKEVVKVLGEDHSNIKLNVNYIISGISDDKRGTVTICSNEDMQKLRDTFRVVFFVHVYSVNKGCHLLDKVAFSSINTFEDIPLCMGLIKNDVCFKRTPDEINSLKSHSQQTVSSNKLQNVPKILKDSKPIKVPIKSEHENGNNVDKAKDIEKVHDKNIKQEISSPTKKIESAFKNADKKNVNKISKGIAGYFSKANGMSAPKNIKTEVETAKVIKEDAMEKEIEIKTEKDVIEKVVKENLIKKKESKSNNVIKPNARVDKKRKRVLHVSDSESDTEENDPFTEHNMQIDNESDDEIPPTPTINTVKITSGIVNPKKRRKMVDKTYTDEDGYILTKKEEVYESCSDNEGETAKKENQTANKLEIKIEVSPKVKNNKAVAKKRISPPQKGKQATMTSFFKKV